MRRSGLVVFLAAVVLAGCGSSSPSPDQVLRGLANNTRSAGLVETVSVIQLHDVVVRGAPPGSLSLIASPDERVGAAGAVNLVTNDGSISLSTPNFGTVELDVVKGSFYMDFPPALLPASLKTLPWLYVNADAISQLKNPSLIAFFELLNAIDPAYYLAFLKGYVGDARYLGTKSVHGVSCRQYRYTIDLSLAAAELSGAAKRLVEAARDLLHLYREPLTSCVDSAGRMRESVFTVSLNDLAFPAPGQPFSSERISGSVTVTNQIWNYRGGNFTTKPPARYLDISALLAGMT
jgi:hypothetical protein